MQLNNFVDHIDLTVVNLQQTQDFYQKLLVDFLGWKVIYKTENYFMIGHLPGLRIGFTQVKKEFSKEGFNREKIGLHHFGLRLGSWKMVDEVYQKLLELGAEILDKPAHYPDYNENFYAVYFLDPNGFKMEFVSYNKD